MDATSIQIRLNGEAHALSSGADATTVSALLESLGLGQRRVAVEINGAIVPRAAHPDTTVAEGDRVEVVTFVGGG